MAKVYEFDQFGQNGTIPRGYSKLAVAAWQALEDYRLYEVDGQLVVTDSLDLYLEEQEKGATAVFYIKMEFDSHAAVEKWLLRSVSDWITDGDEEMVDALCERFQLICPPNR